MKYDTGFCWSRGLRKEINEDSILLQQIRTKRGKIVLAAVSDGIGGLSEGEMASGFLMEELRRWFYGEGMTLLKLKQRQRKTIRLLEKSLSRQLYRSAEKLAAYGEQNRCKLGATFTAIMIIGKHFFVCSVGDSRAVWVSGRKCIWLTKDDVDEKGRLLRCIGSEGWYPLQFKRGRLRGKTLLLVCTDGFWRKLELEDMQKFNSANGQSELEQWLHQMKRILRSRGEKDDMAVVGIYTETI